MKPIDEVRLTGLMAQYEIYVHVGKSKPERLYLKIISGEFPPALSRDDVAWLVKVLQKALEQDDG